MASASELAGMSREEIKALVDAIWNATPQGSGAGGFLRPEQFREWLMENASLREQIDALDREYRERMLDAEQSKRAITKQAQQDMRSAAWNHAGRGLANSSIRDLALADIDAAATLERANIDSRLELLDQENWNAKRRLGDKWAVYDESWDSSRIENAKAAGLSPTSPPGSGPGGTAAPGNGTQGPLAPALIPQEGLDSVMDWLKTQDPNAGSTVGKKTQSVVTPRKTVPGAKMPTPPKPGTPAARRNKQKQKKTRKNKPAKAIASGPIKPR